MLGCQPEGHREASSFLSVYQLLLSLAEPMGFRVRACRHADKHLAMGHALRPEVIATRATGVIPGLSPESDNGPIRISTQMCQGEHQTDTCASVWVYRVCVQSWMIRHFQTPDRFSTDSRRTECKKYINSILQAQNIYGAHALGKAQCYRRSKKKKKKIHLRPTSFPQRLRNQNQELGYKFSPPPLFQK